MEEDASEQEPIVWKDEYINELIAPGKGRETLQTIVYLEGGGEEIQGPSILRQRKRITHKSSGGQRKSGANLTQKEKRMTRRPLRNTNARGPLLVGRETPQNRTAREKRGGKKITDGKGSKVEE